MNVYFFFFLLINPEMYTFEDKIGKKQRLIRVSKTMYRLDGQDCASL